MENKGGRRSWAWERLVASRAAHLYGRAGSNRAGTVEPFAVTSGGEVRPHHIEIQRWRVIVFRTARQLAPLQHIQHAHKQRHSWQRRRTERTNDAAAARCSFEWASHCRVRLAERARLSRLQAKCGSCCLGLHIYEGLQQTP